MEAFREKAAALGAACALAACAALSACSGQPDEGMPELRGTGEVSAGRTDAVLSEAQRDSLVSPTRTGTAFTQFMRLDESYSAFMYSEDVVELAADAEAAISGQGGDPNGLVKCYPEYTVADDGSVTAYFASPPDREYAVYYEFRYDPSADLGDRVEVSLADTSSMPSFADDETVQ